MRDHSGNLLNQITFEEHDGNLNAKKVSLVSAATIYAITTGTNSGNVTLDPGSRTQIVGNLTLSDPKGFIGLVTIGGGNIGNSGNVTLNPSPNFIGLVTIANSVGNATLNPSPNQIGSVTVSNPVSLGAGVANVGFATVSNALAWPDPKTYIGLVTITGSLSAAAGNITLDPGSRTGIVGNITLSDPKGFIGLVTVVGSLSPAAGNVTLDAGSRTGIIGNLTLSDPKGFIGLVTAVGNFGNVGNVTLDAGSKTQIIGNVTLSDPKGFIGLVTIVGSLSPAAGNITLDPGSRTGIVGNVTLSDSKGFIGLTTVKASVLDTYASLATFTMSIASLATSTTGVGRQSTLIDNTTTRYTSAMVYLKVFSGGLAHTPNTLVNVFLLRRDNNSVGDDGAGASDAALTIVNAPLLGNILFNASNVSTAYHGVFDTSPLGPLGPQWGIGLVNQTGAALGGTESNHLKNWIGVNRSLT